ncbi:MAG: tyrosine-type recombinase/integrase, partial [Ruthenibacterium sp.]
HEKCSLHALRHSFGSILLRDKVEIAVISQLLGHADISTTYNVYIHILEEQKIEALQSFNFITPTLQKSN